MQHEPYDENMLNYFILNKEGNQVLMEYPQWKEKTLEKPTTSEAGKFRRELSNVEIKTFEDISWKILGLGECSGGTH